MKIYEKYEHFEFPDDMKKIMDYLRAHGTVYVSAGVIEDFYRRYSEDEFCAQWMNVDGNILEHFSDWLYEFDV